jgi:hypothetical protein
MALYQKVDGAWVLCQRPYVKYNNVWTAGRTAWIKINGQWVRAYSYDTTPPEAPMLDLILHEVFEQVGGKQVLKERWIRVGARMPGAHNPDVAMIRVLTDYDEHAPTSPLGATNTTLPDETYPTEPWSDRIYGPAAEHHDTSNVIYKQWPRNAKAGTQLRGGKKYHFGAWAVDAYGNWGPGTVHNVDIPQGGVDEPTVHRKEIYFNINSTGSWHKKKFEAGDLIQSNTSTGLFFYGYQFAQYLNANSRVTSAQIALVRGDNSGEQAARVSMFWHAYPNAGALPATNSPVAYCPPSNPAGNTLNARQPQFHVGMIARGETKWFDIPSQFIGDLKAGNARGIGLYNGAGQTVDYSGISGNAYANSGQIHLVWEDPV